MELRSLVERRKEDHLDLFRDHGPSFKAKTTLLEQVHLLPRALPETALEDIRLETRFLGKVLAAPLLISPMTGGTPRAGQINHDLAGVAQELGIGFGLGSQRAMIENPSRTASYQVRDIAPDIFLAGNIGIAQVTRLPPVRIAEAVQTVGADALYVHLNPAMEAVQVEGDSDLRGGLEALARLVEVSPVPVIVKEVGSGIDPDTARRVSEIGIRCVDVSGAGGTSWVGVEVERARVGRAAVGETFWDWGIPTAACLLLARAADLTLIGSGGVRNGLDVARCLALGARLGGIAAPVLQAYLADGIEGARRYLSGVIEELRLAVFLTGGREAADLARCPRVLGPDLALWADAPWEGSRA